MTCPQCIEIENYYDEQILYLKREIKKTRRSFTRSRI